jgi:hypothetical protein
MVVNMEWVRIIAGAVVSWAAMQTHQPAPNNTTNPVCLNYSPQRKTHCLLSYSNCTCQSLSWLVPTKHNVCGLPDARL